MMKRLYFFLVGVFYPHKEAVLVGKEGLGRVLFAKAVNKGLYVVPLKRWGRRLPTIDCAPVCVDYMAETDKALGQKN